MRLPEAPTKPLSQLSDDDLLGLFRTLGRIGKQALRRALALMPEIIRRALYRRAGFSSPIDFAVRKLEVSADVVNRVLALHAQIGHMPELWDLFATGEQGWSKLEIVAGVATPDTAAWWRDVVRRCSRSELSEYVRRHKEQRKSQEVAAMASLWPKKNEPNPADAAPGDGPEGEAQAKCKAAAASKAPATLAGEATRLSTSVPPVSAETPTRAAAPQEEEAADSANQLPDQDLLGRPQIDSSPKLQPVTLWLSKDDAELLRAFQAEFLRKHRQSISLGEVVSMLIHGNWGPIGEGARPVSTESAPESIAVDLGSRREPSADLSCAPRSNDKRMDDKRMDDKRMDDKRMDDEGLDDEGLDDEGLDDEGLDDEGLDDEGLDDEGLDDQPADGRRSVALQEPSAIETVPALRDADRKLGPANPAIADQSGQALADAERTVGRAAPAIAIKCVEVVVRIAEAGNTWAKRLVGVVPAAIAETFRNGSAIVLGDLFCEAVRAASKARGDRVPDPVRRFLALRSGLRCETQDCPNPLQEIAHIVPRAEGGSHHPDNLRGTCKLHHGMEHQELWADTTAGKVVKPGTPLPGRYADRAYQAARIRAVSSG